MSCELAAGRWTNDGALFYKRGLFSAPCRHELALYCACWCSQSRNCRESAICVSAICVYPVYIRNLFYVLALPPLWFISATWFIFCSVCWAAVGPAFYEQSLPTVSCNSHKVSCNSHNVQSYSILLLLSTATTRIRARLRSFCSGAGGKCAIILPRT